MNHWRHQNYKNKDTEMEYLKNTWKNRILKVANSLLELEKDFTETKDRALIDR